MDSKKALALQDCYQSSAEFRNIVDALERNMLSEFDMKRAIEFAEYRRALREQMRAVGGLKPVVTKRGEQ